VGNLGTGRVAIMSAIEVRLSEWHWLQLRVKEYIYIGTVQFVIEINYTTEAKSHSGSKT
jgi:hypothetical protein